MDDETLSKGERTRRAILDAAYRLFVEQGYAATSMRQIAEGAGLALGGIYNHFAGKEDVFTAIILERHPYHQIIPVLKTAQGNTIEEFVRNAAKTLVDELGHHPDFLNLTLIEIVEFEGRHVSLLFENILPELLPLAQRVDDLEGNLRPIPLPLLVRAFMGMFFSYYITEILLAQAMPLEMQKNALDQFVEIFLHGILAESS